MEEREAQSLALIERFVEAIEHLNRQMRSGGLDEWQGRDMTIPQVKGLVLLEQSGPLRMGAIAAHLGTTLSTTTNIVDRLVEKELVKRGADPNDRRVVICELTQEGRTAIEEFWRMGRERVLLITELLGPEQLAIAVQGLELIRGAEEEVQRRLRASQVSAPTP